VSGISENSGAESAGLQPGDVITRVDNIEITKFADLSGYLKTKRPNDIVNVEIERDNQVRIIPVTLSNININRIEFLNMTFRNLTKEEKANFELSDGVRILESNNSWWYNRLGIQPGYVITALNNQEIKSIEDLKSLQNKYGERFEKDIERIEFVDNYGRKRELVLR
jgi:serine protease DegQ